VEVYSIKEIQGARVFSDRNAASYKNGILYFERDQNITYRPVLFVHGIGGHHGNFRHLHRHLKHLDARISNYYVDLPAFGNSLQKKPSLKSIEEFLLETYRRISEQTRQRIVIVNISASAWFTSGHSSNKYVDSSLTVAINPIIVPKEKAEELRILQEDSLLDVRKDFMTSYFNGQSLAEMNKDILGRPTVTVAFLRELWEKQANSDPFEGWKTVLVLDSLQDPLRRYRILPRNDCTILQNIPSNSHTLENGEFSHTVAQALLDHHVETGS
jgi:hypothetical protein